MLLYIWKEAQSTMNRLRFLLLYGAANIGTQFCCHGNIPLL